MSDPIWISIRDGEIVGTPYGPAVPNGKYMIVEKLDSEGGGHPNVVGALCQYLSDLKHPTELESIPRHDPRGAAMTTDITPENVARYDASAIMWSLDGIEPKQTSDPRFGNWVKYSDYQALSARLASDAKAHEKEIAVWAENYAALERKLAEVEANLRAAKETIDEHFAAKEAAEARIVQMTTAWGEDALAVDELKAELARLRAVGDILAKDASRFHSALWSDARQEKPHE